MDQSLDLYRLLYVSNNAEVGVDVDAIVKAAKERNNAEAVTGALWFDGQHFLQVLEGKKEALHSVLKRILGSSHHSEVNIICFQPVAERLYENWPLAYYGLAEHNRDVAEQFAGGADYCLRSLPSRVLFEMLRFLEEERQKELSRQVG